MKVNRVRYQFGSLYQWKGVREDVWYFRYRDYDENGWRGGCYKKSRKLHSRPIFLTEETP